ncbi:MAG TPA: hypothetical protein VFA55_02210, partial [Candidatus Kapabacteria bacterium]|nr:hypothetical protein [Candidatus Kapabacteria bacterium]
MRKLILFLWILVNAFFTIVILDAQDPARKWIPAPPSTLGTGYYVVDSYDAANAPWRPTYSFND